MSVDGWWLKMGKGYLGALGLVALAVGLLLAFFGTTYRSYEELYPPSDPTRLVGSRHFVFDSGIFPIRTRRGVANYTLNFVGMALAVLGAPSSSRCQPPRD